MRAIRHRGLSVGLATGLYGISFGALATASGLDLAQAMVLSMVMFTGGGQFAFAGVVGAGGSEVGAVVATLLLGLRNTVYGVVMSRVMPRRPALRALAAQLTIDESTATALSGRTPREQRAGFWAAGVAVWVFWALFSLLGALAGQAIADPAAWGLDAAAAAAFLALLWPRLVSRDAVAVAVAAAFVALLVTPMLPAGLPVLAAGGAGVAAGLLLGRRATGSRSATEGAA
ncbi:AzlC family ABC transporter permease [Brachybacterium sp. EF45031]|nr:AzlC family ABC transporter permease [Brachybacterium sillae]